MKILVVDDDPMAAEMVCAILEEGEHEANVVNSGIEALEYCQEHQAPDLIISDMNMPLMSGLELFETLRELELQTPFVLLSGDDPETYRAQAPGLAACLMKDADLFENLLELLEHFGPAQ